MQEAYTPLALRWSNPGRQPSSRHQNAVKKIVAFLFCGLLVALIGHFTVSNDKNGSITPSLRHLRTSNVDGNYDSIERLEFIESIHSARFLDTNSTEPAGTNEAKPTWETALEYAAIVVLILMSAMFSGLTLGLLGLDTNQLQIVREAGTPEERGYANKIWPIRQNGNLLLCTLLLGNVSVNALLSILMAEKTSGTVGFLVSTAVITIFGEIVPQAACSRYALYIGSRAVPIVRVFVVLLYLAAKPLSLGLDYFLGQEVGKFYSDAEFDRLIENHAALISTQRRQIMQGALKFGGQKVADCMTHRKDMFTLHASDKLSFSVMSNIFQSGYSRIPVWDDKDTQIIGLLYAKDLMLIVPKDEIPVIAVVSFFERDYVPIVDDDQTLEDVLKTLNNDQVHFAVVRGIDTSDEDRDPTYSIVGCITLEDIMEQILQMDVTDEFDQSDADGVTKVRHEARKRVMDMDRLKLLDSAHHNDDLSDALAQAVASTLLATVPIFKMSIPRQITQQDGTVQTVQSTLSLGAVLHLVRKSRVLYLSSSSRRGFGATSDDPADNTTNIPSTTSNATKDAVKPTTSAVLSRQTSSLLPGLNTEGPAGNALLEVGGYLYHRGDRTNTCALILDGSFEVVSGNDQVYTIKRTFDVLAARALQPPHGDNETPYQTDFSARLISRRGRVLLIERSDFLAAFDYVTQPEQEMMNENHVNSQSLVQISTINLNVQDSTQDNLDNTNVRGLVRRRGDSQPDANGYSNPVAARQPSNIQVTPSNGDVSTNSESQQINDDDQEERTRLMK